MKSLSTRAVCYGLLIVLGLLAALPNVLPGRIADRLPDWYVGNTLALGLDLRGGSHLLLAVDARELIDAHHEQTARDLGAALRAASIPHRPPEATDTALRVEPRDPAQLDALERAVRAFALESATGAGAPPAFAVRVRGTAIELELTRVQRAALVADAVERSIEVLRRRLDETGLVEPSITRQGDDGVLVQMPGVSDPAEIRALLGTTARMTFHWVDDGRAGETITLPGTDEEAAYRVEQQVAMEGKHISDAQLAFNAESGLPVVSFRLDGAGARLFGELTRTNIGRPLAIVLDGRVITAPVIQSAIPGGRGEISGSFTATEASALALLLRAGALPAPLEVVEERTVGPDLGSDAIAMGISTGLVGAALVVGFMLAGYGRWGLIACAGLGVNIGLVFGILSTLGATLTLPGIAGIILTIGMAVDANILINERIREETQRGRSAIAAVQHGFSRAWATILDSNITTLIAVSLLFLLGSGPVRGFAVTIGIGLITSMFTAIAAIRLIMEWRVRRMGRRRLAIGRQGLPGRLTGGQVNFMRGRVAGLAGSLLLSVASVVLFFTPGLDYGIDFTGGTLVEVRTTDTPVETLRGGLASAGLHQAAIQEFGDGGHYLVRLPVATGAAEAGPITNAGSVDELRAAVRAVAPDAEFPRIEMVGPKVSGGFAEATILAVVSAGLGMLGYLWMRFESHFALAATLTVLLDLTKTIGFFVLAGIEFNLTAVAALLALIGYSINDKVVVFDRVRETLRLTPDKPLLTLLNESIGSTLTRTVFTSATTFLAILPMGIAGGAAVASFALPMLFGIVVGTSSSVLIAAPILYYLGQGRARRGLAQLRPTGEELRRQLELAP
ncbi:MAG: protein translocase subunit SecD [Pseudomonadales bacterium]|nr:protein translocase subunit SecD [Pseudomonadales bacterium]